MDNPYTSFFYNHILYKSGILKGAAFLTATLAGYGAGQDNFDMALYATIASAAFAVLDTNREGKIALLAQQGRLEEILKKESKTQ